MRGALTRYMKTVWKLNPVARPAVRIPCTMNTEFHRSLQRLCRSLVGQSTAGKMVKDIFLSRIRFVSSPTISIAHALASNISFAKQVTREIPACTCELLCKATHQRRPDTGHFAMRASEIEEGSMENVLHANATSAPLPGKLDLDNILIAVVASLGQVFKGWMGRGETEPMRDAFDTATAVEAGRSVLPMWCHSQHIESIMEASRQALIPTTPNMWQLIRDSRGSQNWDTMDSRFPTTSEVNAIRCTLKGIAVVSTLDRNPGAIFVECPVSHHSALGDTFFANTNGSYTCVSRLISHSSIIGNWAATGVNTQVSGSFDKAGSLPYAYILRKEKDTSRVRPIVSFSKAPHRVHLRRIARAFHFLLQHLDSPSYTLWCAMNVRMRIKEIEEAIMGHPLSIEGKEGVSIIGTTSDIKDMYTCLPHVDIARAVDWSISTFMKASRRKAVNIRRYGRPRGRTGPVYNSVSRIEVTCATIGSYVQQILKQCFFTCGSITMQQLIGIPMGSHISPPLAIATCMYSEYKFECSRGYISRPLGGLRYMDDILHMTVRRRMPTPVEQTEEDAAVEDLLCEARGIYPETMRVILTADTQPLPFLESEIAWVGSATTMWYMNKNREAIKRGSQQKIKRFRDGKSFSSQHSLRSVVQCMLQRCTRFTTLLSTRLLAVFQLIEEFMIISYPAKLIRRAIHRLMRAYPEEKNFWGITILCLDNLVQ